MVLVNDTVITRKFAKSRLFCIDIAEAMLIVAKKAHSSMFKKRNFCCADAENLPFKQSSIDIIYSNLSIQWCPEPLKVFSNVNSILNDSEGLFVFSTLGPITLRELRESFEGYSSFFSLQPNFYEIGITLQTLECRML